MHVTLRYYRNRQSVGIALRDIQGHLAGADVCISFKSLSANEPEWIKKLPEVHCDLRAIGLCGTSSSLSLYRGGRAAWKEIIPKVLVHLRDTFDPRGRIVMPDPPSFFDRRPRYDDLLALPRHAPFGEDEQLTFWPLDILPMV